MADNNTQAVIAALQGGATAIQNAIMNAATNAAAAAAAAHPQPCTPPAPVAGAFARTPLRSWINQVLDYLTKGNQKYFEEATKSLYGSDRGFDMEPGSFQLFINLVHTRARDLGMLEANAKVMVPEDQANPGVRTPINSIADYGRTTLEQVMAWEATFIGNQDCNSRNSKMLYDLLMNSLSTQGIQRIQSWHAQYHLANQEESRGSLFKVSVRESYLDSNATVSMLCLNLTSLDEYILTDGSDITSFNAYVQGQTNGLTAQGHMTSDMVVNLFKGYKVVGDTAFKEYIRTIENGHKDGTAIMTAATLMLKAVNFDINILTQDKWEQPLDRQKEVLALQAQVESLKKLQKKDAKKVAFDKPKSGPKTNTARKTKPEKPSWLHNDVQPKEDLLTKYCTWNKTKWYWCSPDLGGSCVGKWRVHKPSDCQGITKSETKTAPKMEKGDKKGQKCKANALNDSIYLHSWEKERDAQKFS